MKKKRMVEIKEQNGIKSVNLYSSKLQDHQKDQANLLLRATDDEQDKTKAMGKIFF